jgi:hypothetical protein
VLNCLVIFAGIALLATHSAAAQENPEKPKREAYTAVVLSTSGATASMSTSINVYIDRFTTDAEMMEYFEILAEGGGKHRDQLRRTLEKIKVGAVAPTGGLGNDIAIARAVDTPEGRRITAVTARTMSFVELRNMGRTTDYPFGMIQFTLDAEGKGQGILLLAFQPKINKDGVLEIESYGHNPLKLLNVKRYE